jgi:hypothetical protein
MYGIRTKTIIATERYQGYSKHEPYPKSAAKLIKSSVVEL